VTTDEAPRARKEDARLGDGEKLAVTFSVRVTESLLFAIEDFVRRSHEAHGLRVSRNQAIAHLLERGLSEVNTK
jgi:hypothetical protein